MRRSTSFPFVSCSPHSLLFLSSLLFSSLLPTPPTNLSFFCPPAISIIIHFTCTLPCSTVAVMRWALGLASEWLLATHTRLMKMAKPSWQSPATLKAAGLDLKDTSLSPNFPDGVVWTTAVLVRTAGVSRPGMLPCRRSRPPSGWPLLRLEHKGRSFWSPPPPPFWAALFGAAARMPQWWPCNCSSGDQAQFTPFSSFPFPPPSLPVGEVWLGQCRGPGSPSELPGRNGDFNLNLE